MLFDFDDLLIQPAKISAIRSRSETNPYYGDKLPLMTAPMDTVVDGNNHHYFSDLGITVVFPRNTPQPWMEDFLNDEHFTSFSLTDFDMYFLENDVEIPDGKQYRVLIDIANGHMKDLIQSSKTAKQKYGDQIVLMVGNVANPTTFYDYGLAGVDYVRIGIGNGGGCLTTVQTGVGYPMASLISECNDIKKRNPFIKTKIVADGGFKKYADVIKALALGADYVMLGSIFNKSLESCGLTTDSKGEVIDQYSKTSLEMFNVDIPLFKNFRGMSTKEVQKSWGNDELKTSEGVVRTHKVEYTLKGWVDNFTSYLKSAMSYTNNKKLPNFIGGVNYNLITKNSFERFNK
jgi:GMP reductase